jgi:hypothetical protein
MTDHPFAQSNTQDFTQLAGGMNTALAGLRLCPLSIL